MARKRHQRRSNTELKKLKRQLETTGVLNGSEVVLEPRESEKMSELLLAFIEPYSELVTTHEAYDRLIAIATLAWNAALLTGTERQRLLNEAIKAIVPSSDPVARDDLMGILAELIERKERYFAHNRRFIVGYQLTETQDTYHLSVASTL